MDRPAGRPQPIQASPAFPTIPLSSVLRCRSVPHGLPLPHSLRAVMSHSGAMDCPPGSARFPRHLSPSSPPKRPSMSCGVPALHLACTLPPTPPSVPSPLPPVGPIAPVGWGGDLHCWGRLGLHFVSSSGGLSRFPGSRCFTCRRRRTQDVLGTSAHVHAVSTLSSQPPCRSRSPSSCTTAKLHNCTTSAPAAAPVSRCLPRYRYLGRLALTSLEGPRIRQTCPRQQHPTSTPSTYLPTLPNLPLSLRLPPCPRRILPAWTGCLAAPVADLY